MHDIRTIRADPAAFDAAMARRGVEPQAAALVRLYTDHVDERQRFDAERSRQKQLAAEIGRMKRQGEDTGALEAEARSARLLIDVGDDNHALEATLARLPNILDPDVPDGRDEADNVVLHIHGDPARKNAARQHFELGEALGMMDFAAAAKLAGSRFTVLRGPLQRLARALGQFMLERAIANGYEETEIPLLVNDATMFGTGQLPKFADDLFRTTDNRWLVPTAEVPLTNLAANEILPEQKLPWRVTALTPCFRSEAGSAGRDTRGMLRQHQFPKVELVSITTPQQSAAEHERMTACAEGVLTDLGLAWRRVLLCAGDTGFAAAKTYDLEVWLPGQGAWREISSCSTCRDFQARRMNARYRPKDAKGTAFVHTLNGSGVAVGRALIAVMETFQLPDGSIAVPPVLAPWMGGIEAIQPA